MFPVPDDDPLASLSDEDRKRLLEEYAPSPIHTGAVTRGVQGFSSLPMPRGALMPDRPALTSARAPSDDEAFAEFARAQSRDETLSGLSHVGSLLDGFARDYVGLGPNRNVSGAPTRSATDAFLARRNLQQQEANRKRQQDLDAVNLDKTRAETARAKAQAQSTEAEAARDAALNKKDSTETNAARASAKGLLKGKISPEAYAALDDMTGLQIRDYALKFGVSLANAEQLAGFRERQLSMTEEQQAFQRQMEKWRAGLDMERLKQDWTKFGLSQEQQLELAKLRQKYETEKDARERTEKLAEREVGGFQFQEGRTPSLQNAKIMTDLASESRKVQNGLRKLKSLYAQYGTELWGTHSITMASEFKAITDALRVMANMGVPNGKDYEMLAMEISNPSSPSDLFTTKSSGLSRMDALESRLNDNVAITADVLGYKPTGSSGSAAAPRVGTRANPAPSTGTYEDPDRPGVRLDVEDAPKPSPRPNTPAPSASGVREVSTKGMKPGDLKKYLIREKFADGPIRLSNGKMFNWSGGKLLPVTE